MYTNLPPEVLDQLQGTGKEDQEDDIVDDTESEKRPVTKDYDVEDEDELEDHVADQELSIISEESKSNFASVGGYSGVRQ